MILVRFHLYCHFCYEEHNKEHSTNPYITVTSKYALQEWKKGSDVFGTSPPFTCYELCFMLFIRILYFVS
jgi:hypothetical protein